MRLWEIREKDEASKYGRRGYKMSGMRGYRDEDSVDEAYECGYEDGYRDAMKEAKNHYEGSYRMSRRED